MRLSGATIAAVVAVAVATLASPIQARKLRDGEKITYNYIISVGCIALVAVMVPIHVLFHSSSARFAWLALALVCAALSGVAACVGAGLGAILWQAIPTGVFMIFLALLILLQIVGGWHVLRQRARAPGRVKVAVLEDRHWRDDVSKDEYARLVAQSGVSIRALRLGAEPDQDAVAAALVGMRPRNNTRRKNDFPSDNRNPAEFSNSQVAAVPGLSLSQRARHEPSGLVMLGGIKYARLWLDLILEALRRQNRWHLVILHHACMVTWWTGMFLGAFNKTGIYKDTSGGNMNLRTGGIWIQALLLLLAVYLLPYTRAIVRFGSRVWPRALLLVAQAAISLALGICMVVFGREKESDGNNIAYAVSLLIAATAAALWSIVAVCSYQTVVQRLVSLPANDENHKVRAYMTALVTRPRHGYQGSAPVMRWGEVDRKGFAALEVSLDEDIEASSEGVTVADDTIPDTEAHREWNLLHAAANRRW